MSDPSPDLDTLLKEDIDIATRTRLPVLITARPDQALAVARTIVDRSGSTDLTALHIANADAGRTILAGLTDEWLRRVASAGITLLLQEIQNLDPLQQLQLCYILDGRFPWSATDSPRFITTSSVSLYDRVRDNSFDPRLFNRVNLIHIMLPLCEAQCV